MRERQAADYERFRVFFTEAPEAIFIVDEAGRITDMNREAEQLVGYERDELSGRPIEVLVPSEAAHEHVGLRHHFLRQPSRRPMFTGGNVEIVAKGGRHIPVEILLNALPDGFGGGAIAHVRDVTELRELQRELERLVEERTVSLRRVTHDLESFADVVAHELRRPLRAMSGFASILKEEVQDRLSQDGKDAADRIVANCVYMGALIEGLLALCKASRAEPVVRQCDTARIVDEALGRLAGELNGTEVVRHELAHMMADPVLMAVVWVNLLSNAVKFTRGTASPRIEIGSVATAEGPVWYVQDNGVGVPLEFAARAFEPFQRLHRGFEGQGIGLALVRRILQQHDGDVWFEPVSVGTRVCFRVGPPSTFD